jgi:hypothetical protein
MNRDYRDAMRSAEDGDFNWPRLLLDAALRATVLVVIVVALATGRVRGIDLWLSIGGLLVVTPSLGLRIIVAIVEARRTRSSR